MRCLWIALVFAALQEADEPAVRLHRAFEEKLGSAQDPEVRRRVSDLRDFLRNRVVTALTGEPVTPDDAAVLRFHDPRTLLAPIRDRSFPVTWEVRLNGPEPVPVLDEPLEPPIGEEQIVDLIKERVAPGSWEGNQTIEKTPSGELLIQARPSIQRAVARFLRVLEAETRLEWRVALDVFAIADPSAVAIPVSGVLDDADVKRLETARRVGTIELPAPATQRVSTFSGREAELLVGYDGDVPRRAKIHDGLCAEVMILPGDEGRVQVHARLAFRKLLGVDELSTPKGPIQSPRFAESSLWEESRMIPTGRRCVLGLLGPISDEAKIPPYLLVVTRVDRSR